MRQTTTLFEQIDHSGAGFEYPTDISGAAAAPEGYGRDEDQIGLISAFFEEISNFFQASRSQFVIGIEKVDILPFDQRQRQISGRDRICKCRADDFYVIRILRLIFFRFRYGFFIRGIRDDDELNRIPERFLIQDAGDDLAEVFIFSKYGNDDRNIISATNYSKSPIGNRPPLHIKK